MKVIRARVCGFCMGVRRAVDLAAQEARAAAADAMNDPAQNGTPRVYTMGPLIHNPQALQALESQGVIPVDEESLPKTLEGTTIIIRAHGITPQLESNLHERGARIVDATCPRVRANQMKAKKLTEQGYRIFIAGEHTHGEIQGIQGYSPTSIILGSAQEAESIAAELASTMEGVPTALIGQTTISTEEFQAVELALKQFFPEILIMDSICSATKERQKALRELCGQVEALIVVGGKESANTRRLYNIAVAHNKPAWLVENADDIPEAVRCYCVVGLTAGASTPDSVIDEIQANLENG